MRKLTKRAMILCSNRLPLKHKELWQAAASLEGISQSEFLRNAIRDRSTRILPVEFLSVRGIKVANEKKRPPASAN